MPDIDIDFCFEKRDRVIEYIISRYGADRVAQIITFGTMAARNAIRDVGRALAYGYGEVDRIAKMIPFAVGMTIEKALEINKPNPSDPVDVLVLSPVPIITGAVVRCRPLGMLKMADESGEDAKILAVPVEKLCGLYRNIKSYTDLPELTISQISHFFEHYKDLEIGKWVRINGWVGIEEASKEILEGVTRYQAAEKKPVF